MLENTSICVIRLKNVSLASWDVYPDYICLSISPVWQVQELQSQLDQSKRSVTDLKRHCRRLTSDLQDARVLTDSLQGRAHELDRKQRRSVAFACNINIQRHALRLLEYAFSSSVSPLRLCPCVCVFVGLTASWPRLWNRLIMRGSRKREPSWRIQSSA